MTKSQFVDVLCNPDNYIGCQLVIYHGFPCVFEARIFYTTPDKIVYCYNDFNGCDAYGTITEDNYILCQFKHLHDRQRERK